ncbi:sensor histidine kinase [Dysgonomonas sp. 25]|uniref:sensor histidine kinase n=1 Tax=Dysgonomonas sp. 25 TaxID=2302933 RepID=UPI001C87823E|nr:histidine kinase [Dysgonomonas sp. 25]NDV68951.1 histidine kinase [Dysgonomonas sp. 25]
MQQKYNTDSSAIKLMILPKYRIIRHLILLVLLFAITFGLIWSPLSEESLMPPLERYGSGLVFIGILVGGSYLNIYVLAPRLLMKNRWGLYFSSLALIGLLMIINIFLLYTAHLRLYEHLAAIENFAWRMGLNFASAFLSFMMLFVGTSSFVIFKNWILDSQQAEELETTTTQMELKLLEKQINPHFLFNMLNNANIMIKGDPDRASSIILKMKDMLRYQMNDNAQEKVFLKDDILFLNDYLELEKTRRDAFEYSISQTGSMDKIQVPPLLFITFVENAVKHNMDSDASYVHIWFEVVKNKLIFICENSIPSKPAKKKEGGLGLTNIRRRLDLLYPNNYSLKLDKTDSKYTARLELKI